MSFVDLRLAGKGDIIFLMATHATIRSPLLPKIKKKSHLCVNMDIRFQEDVFRII